MRTAYLAAGECTKAAAEFEKIIGHRGWDEWEVFAPLAQLGLARAYAMQGDRENSRKAYDDFFTTWKDADPDIPILRQAKAEYKRLSATTPPAAFSIRQKAIAPSFSKGARPQLTPFARPVDGFSRLFVGSAAAFGFALVP